MPEDGRSKGGVELLELRVLDGPNRFFARPAIKLEFGADLPGAADATAAAAGEAVRRLHALLDLPAPRLTGRTSVDGHRALVAYPWRRRTISQAIGASAARIARISTASSSTTRKSWPP